MQAGCPPGRGGAGHPACSTYPAATPWPPAGVLPPFRPTHGALPPFGPRGTPRPPCCRRRGAVVLPAAHGGAGLPALHRRGQPRAQPEQQAADRGQDAAAAENQRLHVQASSQAGARRCVVPLLRWCRGRSVGLQRLCAAACQAGAPRAACCCRPHSSWLRTRPPPYTCGSLLTCLLAWLAPPPAVRPAGLQQERADQQRPQLRAGQPALHRPRGALQHHAPRPPGGRVVPGRGAVQDVRGAVPV